jgi:hypothetical protein
MRISDPRKGIGVSHQILTDSLHGFKKVSCGTLKEWHVEGMKWCLFLSLSADTFKDILTVT